MGRTRSGSFRRVAHAHGMHSNAVLLTQASISVLLSTCMRFRCCMGRVRDCGQTDDSELQGGEASERD